MLMKDLLSILQPPESFGLYSQLGNGHQIRYCTAVVAGKWVNSNHSNGHRRNVCTAVEDQCFVHNRGMVCAEEL
jgi:hypothetical protein